MTHIRWAFSEQVGITSGMLQDSVLGPLLLLIYVNELPEGLNLYLNMFADDSKFMREVRNDKDSINLQRDLDNLKS